MSLATKKLAEEYGRAKQERGADGEDTFLFKPAQRVGRRAKATTKYGENSFHGLKKKINDVLYQRGSTPDKGESIALAKMPQPLCEASTGSGLTNTTRIRGESLACVTEGSVNDGRVEDEHAFDHPSIYAE
ncbi:hypothetical protein APHAL10511_000135 [Amanita phalloides]|nr:hypothetical protein APHAL10511_000135 [Amanita phalloides]